MRRALSWGLVAAFAVPWLLGEWAKTELQPGLVDSAARDGQLVDFIIIGSIVFALSMWMVAAFACWIVGVMKGPRRDGDPFPPETPRNER
jgi:hypothetical protein